MIRLQELLVVCCMSTVLALAARTPKIYNALISSDENLSPSQAFPIVEPVLRTTALGVAPYAQPLFQPVVVHPQVQQENAGSKVGINAKTETPSNIQKIPSQQAVQPSQILSYNDAYPLYPLAYDPYFQYGYHRDFVYSPLPPLPYYQQPVYIDYGPNSQQNHVQTPQNLQNQGHNVGPPRVEQIENKKEQVETTGRPVMPVLPPLQSAPPHVNFKKNPDIPDVIPPLPFTLRKDRNQKRNLSN